MEEENCRKKSSNGYSNDSEWWAILLPYLTPTELAAISSTCKTLSQISTAVTRRRTSDVSGGFENLLIPFLTGDSHSPPYSYFFYTPTQTLRVTPDYRQPWGSVNDARLRRPPEPFLFRVEGGAGCLCASDCADRCCPCLECGPSCARPECGNRATQGGVSLRLKIARDERKGWGLFAAEFIPAGRFVCEYAGEVLSTKEGRERQRRYDKSGSMAALLVVKEHLPSGNTCLRMNIDATRMGNIARFINHSCDGGNLDTVMVRSSGALLPRVCFFSSRDIHESEELTFSYGDVSLNPDGRPCFCGASSCAGILPSEST
ncbi:hypothetical protein ACS0TY_026494 [Phlomoides rotata]